MSQPPDNPYEAPRAATESELAKRGRKSIIEGPLFGLALFLFMTATIQLLSLTGDDKMDAGWRSVVLTQYMIGAISLWASFQLYRKRRRATASNRD
ncbi:MAG: hypothetical protein KDA42_10270 [Planctomycetales bacterium]|nr:hypothetical protein [Planctomycetales bacterium]